MRVSNEICDIEGGIREHNQPINQPTNQIVMKKLLQSCFGKSVRKLWGGVNP